MSQGVPISDVRYVCPAGETSCLTTEQCVPIEWWCDNMVDCDDQTDELSCETCRSDQISCGDGTCFDSDQRCDGINQCRYGRDEQGCVAISARNTEPVHIIVKGTLHSLCHDDQVASKSDDICKAAGFRSTEIVSSDKTTDLHTFCVAKFEKEHLTFKESSICPDGKVVHLHCTDSDCGRKSDGFRKKRIIGGHVSSKGEWPWSVALRSGDMVICGGSVVDKTWVITAGHCVKDLVENPQILSVIAGVNDINDAERQVRYISEVILHPEYNFIFNADIAILRLQKPLVFNENIRPLCLPWDMRQFSPADMCYVTGYGVSDMKDYYTTLAPRFMRHIKTKIVEHSQCQDLYSHKTTISDSMLCAGYTSGEFDACKGDSGGGLFCENTDGRWILAGVVSWGDMCGNTNRPGVYTNVVSYMAWIDNVTHPNGEKNVTCDFEQSWCGYTDTSAGDYIWTRKPGDKYIKGTVLHATKTSPSDDVQPSEASIITPSFAAGSFGCLSFSFLFSGNSNLTLSVYGTQEDAEVSSRLLWRMISHYPATDKWKTTEFNVPDDVTRLKFVSLHNHGGISGLSLDNVTVSKTRCKGSDFLQCNFNTGDTCQYQQFTGPKVFPWKIANNHTTNDVYIKAGGNFSEFGYLSISQLVSPKLGVPFTELPHCVTFSFNKNSQTQNNLILATYVNMMSQLGNQYVLWTSKEAKVGLWCTAKVTITQNYYDHIVFEVRRNSYSLEVIDFLVDNIEVSEGVCV